MPVGDVNSTERGSGARYNDGKPDLSLIPPTLLPCTDDNVHWKLLLAMERFMFSGNYSALGEWKRDQMRIHHEDCANVFAYGKNKYAAWNWAKGMNWSIPIACALRHAHAYYFECEENDKESGLPHIGHILCNLVMLRQFILDFPEGNDLPYKVLNNDAR